MREKPRITLGKKMVAMVAAMAVTLCATALFVGYRAYSNRITEFYTQQALSAAATLAGQLTAEEKSAISHRGKALEQFQK